MYLRVPGSGKSTEKGKKKLSEAHGDRLYHVSMDARTIGLMEKLTPTTFGVYVFNRKPTRYHCAKAPL